MLKLGELEVEIGANTKPLKDAEGEIKKTGKSLEMAFSKVGAAIAGALSVEAARRVLMIADNMTRLEGTIKRLTRTTGDFENVWSKLADASNENGIALNDSIALFQRFQSSLKDITGDNADVLDFIDNLQKLGRIGGSSAIELSNALTQLSQGLAGGVIRAEEFNSIMEQAPEIMRSVSKNIEGVNGNVGKLRQLMLDGKLDAQTFYDALKKGAKETNEEFEQLPRTIDMASQALSNNFALAVAKLDKQLGASENIAKLIDMFAEGLEMPSEIERLENYASAIRETIEATKKNMNEPWYKGDGPTRIKELNEDLAKTESAIKKLKGKPLELKITGTTDQVEGPEIDDKLLKRRQQDRAKDLASAQRHLDDIYLASLNNKDRILAIETQALSDIDDLYLDNLISYEEAEAAKIQVGKTSAEQRAELEKKSADEVVLAYDRMNKTIGDQLGQALAGTQSWADAMRTIIANLASQFISAGIGSMFGMPSGGGNIFDGLFGGGRAMGGQTSGMLAHPINERGTPELLEMGGKQFLLPTGQNGNISPLSQGQQQPNISIVSMGEPQAIGAMEISGSDIKIMINNAVKQNNDLINAQLSSGTGKISKSLQSGYKVSRNMGAQ